MNSTFPEGDAIDLGGQDGGGGIDFGGGGGVTREKPGYARPAHFRARAMPQPYPTGW